MSRTVEVVLPTGEVRAFDFDEVEVLSSDGLYLQGVMRGQLRNEGLPIVTSEQQDYDLYLATMNAERVAAIELVTMRGDRIRRQLLERHQACAAAGVL